MFNITTSAMWRWYATSRVLEKEAAIKDSIIALYGKKTGIYANSLERMEQNFRLQESLCKDCVPALKTCTDDLNVFKPRARRRGWTIAVGIPVAFSIGVVSGIIYQTIK